MHVLHALLVQCKQRAANLRHTHFLWNSAALKTAVKQVHFKYHIFIHAGNSTCFTKGIEIIEHWNTTQSIKTHISFIEGSSGCKRRMDSDECLRFRSFKQLQLSRGRTNIYMMTCLTVAMCMIITVSVRSWCTINNSKNLNYLHFDIQMVNVS